MVHYHKTFSNLLTYSQYTSSRQTTKDKFHYDKNIVKFCYLFIFFHRI